MQFGFYSSVLGDRPIEEVAAWAVEDGFQAIEIDAESHLGKLPHEAIAKVRREGIEVCAITVFGNLMDADREDRSRVRSAVEAAIGVAGSNAIPLVGAFPGRDASATEDENYRGLGEYVTDLAEQAARAGVTLAFENWPGPHVDYLATTPEGWSRLFDEVHAPNVGLNFDPSHLIWQGIDPETALCSVADHVVLAHAKDTEIFGDRLQRVGYFGTGWWTYRLPGHGALDWARWLQNLRNAGFDGVVSVEHEDPDWVDTGNAGVQKRRQGLQEALRVLREAAEIVA